MVLYFVKLIGVFWITKIWAIELSSWIQFWTNKTTQQRTIFAKLIIAAITKGNAPIFSSIGGGRSQDQSWSGPCLSCWVQKGTTSSSLPIKKSYTKADQYIPSTKLSPHLEKLATSNDSNTILLSSHLIINNNNVNLTSR